MRFENGLILSAIILTLLIIVAYSLFFLLFSPKLTSYASLSISGFNEIEAFVNDSYFEEKSLNSTKEIQAYSAVFTSASRTISLVFLRLLDINSTYAVFPVNTENNFVLVKDIACETEKCFRQEALSFLSDYFSEDELSQMNFSISQKAFYLVDVSSSFKTFEIKGCQAHHSIIIADSNKDLFNALEEAICID